MGFKPFLVLVVVVLIATALKRFAESVVGRRAAFVGVFGLASIVSVAALWNNYVFMQARALKQEALFSHLAAMPMPAATVFDLNDGFVRSFVATCSVRHR